MAEWAVVFRRRAEKALERLPLKDQRRIVDAMNSLATDPYAAPNVKAMKGGDTYRLRIADYRVIYSLIDDRLVVESSASATAATSTARVICDRFES